MSVLRWNHYLLKYMICVNVTLQLVVSRILQITSDTFSGYIGDLLNKVIERKVLFGGDFNLNLLNYGREVAITNFLDNVTSKGLIPTRISHTSLSLIDNIYCNDISLCTCSGIINTDLRDHFPIFCHVSTLIVQTKVITKYQYIKCSSVQTETQ